MIFEFTTCGPPRLATARTPDGFSRTRKWTVARDPARAPTAADETIAQTAGRLLFQYLLNQRLAESVAFLGRTIELSTGAILTYRDLADPPPAVLALGRDWREDLYYVASARRYVPSTAADPCDPDDPALALGGYTVRETENGWSCDCPRSQATHNDEDGTEGLCAHKVAAMAAWLLIEPTAAAIRAAIAADPTDRAFQLDDVCLTCGPRPDVALFSGACLVAALESGAAPDLIMICRLQAVARAALADQAA